MNNISVPVQLCNGPTLAFKLVSYCSIHTLEMTLDGFEHKDCGTPEVMGCRGAFGYFNITGTITLAEGEVMPPFIAYERKCPRAKDCDTYPGAGEHVWQYAKAIPASDCNYEIRDHGCNLQSGRTYHHYFQHLVFWLFRLCTYRARTADTKYPEYYYTSVNEVGIKHVSNELKMSEYAKDSRYDKGDDKYFLNSRPCDWYSRSTNKGVAEKTNPSDTLGIILGSFFTTYINLLK